MKITISFIPVPGRAAPWLALGFVAVSLLLMIAALALAVHGWSLRADQPELETRLERAQKAAGEVSETPLPPRAELERLQARVAAINQITGRGGDALTDVLLRLETRLPDDVALTTFRYQRRQKEMLAVGEADRAERLTDVLQRLQRDALFREVHLLRQSERSDGRGGVQFELRLKD